MSPSNNTKKRREIIKNLILSEKIGTQEELAARLREMGLKATQSTVSRDIQSLRLSKAGAPGMKHYVLPAAKARLKMDDTIVAMFRQLSKGTDQATNMIILHTDPGMAQALCAIMDKLKWSDVLGTLAGDDTVLLIARNEEAAAEIYQVLHDL
ncbi:MAG: arginine repressor [Lachnospiraceae bacterium]|nr:arginine repressor [Lachnospiraceae bacterium]